MLQVKASEIRMRQKYLSCIPWIVTRADDPDGAAEFMKQLRSKDLEQHDPVTQWLARSVGGDMDAVARGEPVSPALQEVVDEYNMTVLDENVGEGYHRGTGHELIRAPGSTITHVKQDVRFDQESERVRRWTTQFGERGRQVFRYEWRHVKRLLQADWHKRWSGKQVQWNQFYTRVYHDDSRAAQD